jgi:hypothetical protein
MPSYGRRFSHVMDTRCCFDQRERLSSNSDCKNSRTAGKNSSGTAEVSLGGGEFPLCSLAEPRGRKLRSDRNAAGRRSVLSATLAAGRRRSSHGFVGRGGDGIAAPPVGAVEVSGVVTASPSAWRPSLTSSAAAKSESRSTRIESDSHVLRACHSSRVRISACPSRPTANSDGGASERLHALATRTSSEPDRAGSRPMHRSKY